MKFLNGGWLLKDGFQADYAANIYDARVEGDRLLLYAPFQRILNMGMTLDGGLMTLEVSSPARDVITLKMINFKGVRDSESYFKINEDKGFHPVIEKKDESYVFTSGKTSLVISLGDSIDFTYFHDGKKLTESKDRGKARILKDGKETFISDQLVLDVGERIYGLGERFTNFVKNGQSVEIWNADGGTGTEQAYKNIPFYLSNRGYGVFVNSSDKVEFEIGSEKVSRVQFSVPGQVLEYSIIGGDSLKDVLKNYTGLTGRPPLLPAWSFGLWLSTSFTTDYNEETVMSFINGMLERDIPLSVFHFDCLWMKELEWCNFKWDERKFPEPEKMLKKIKDKGIKICVWINPYIAQKSELFEEGAEKGYFIMKENGDVWQWDKWQAGMAVVDFTNPDAVRWYQDKLRNLLKIGVDCFKTDFGERIPVDGVKYYDGSDPEKMHNYYTLLYNKTVYDVIAQERGEDEALVFARSATVGGQKYPVHWGGDSSSNYPSMAETLRAGLSFGLSGFGYWSHDISGFEENATPDLYKRWTQFGLLSSHSRYHGSTQYKCPWLYGEEAVEVSRKFTKLKLSLLPYLLAASNVAHEDGTPMLRAMVLEFQDDSACAELDRQYMLGDSLLVAPVFSEDGTCEFYVPRAEGKWISLLDGKSYEGGSWYHEKFDYMNLPLLVRPNSIIVRGRYDDRTMYDYLDHPTVHVYEPEASAETFITDDYGRRVAEVRMKNEDGRLSVEIDGGSEFKLVVHRAGQNDLTAEGEGGRAVVEL